MAEKEYPCLWVGQAPDTKKQEIPKETFGEIFRRKGTGEKELA